MDYEYILFDMDGTLNESGKGIIHCFQETLRRIGLPEKEDRELIFTVGPPLSDSFAKLGVADKDIEKTIKIYREYYVRDGMFMSEPYKGVREMLAELKSAGKKLLVATSKNEPMTVEILKHYNLDSFFEFVAAATLDSTRITKSDVITYALQNISEKNKDKIIMVGDRENDIAGAECNGIDSVGVLYGYGSKKELEEAGATYIAETPEKVTELLLG